MTSQVRMALLSLILALTGILTVAAYADADGGCFPGTYIVKESSGTQSLWTFSQDGTYQSASSAEVARSFGHIQGAWKMTRARELRSTGLAFTFSGGNGDVGVPPLRTLGLMPLCHSQINVRRWKEPLRFAYRRKPALKRMLLMLSYVTQSRICLGPICTA